MSRVFINRSVAKWMRRSRVSDRQLCDAVAEMQRGLIDADLGGGIVKKRVAIKDRGKSAGARTLIATNRSDRWLFLYAFEKAERANITPKELNALQQVAQLFLDLRPEDLNQYAMHWALQEICHEQKIVH